MNGREIADLDQLAAADAVGHQQRVGERQPLPAPGRGERQVALPVARAAEIFRPRDAMAFEPAAPLVEIGLVQQRQVEEFAANDLPVALRSFPHLYYRAKSVVWLS